MSVEVDDLSELDRQILVEQHLISPELSQVEEGSGIVLTEDRSCCIMINEEDHLRAYKCFVLDWILVLFGSMLMN